MLSLTMVVKDCAATLRQGLSTVAPYVDEIIIVLGGESSDDTEAVAREFTDKVFPFEWRDDFAAARNFALSKVTQPYWMWIDGDDVAVNSALSLRDVVNEMEAQGLSCIWLPYYYQIDEHGNPVQIQLRERIMKTADRWRWTGRIHEACFTDKQDVKIATHEGITVVHSQHGVNLDKTARNVRLLEKALEEEPDRPRYLLALAHAQFSLGKHQEAIELYERYFMTPESKVEQWWAACQASRVCLLGQDYEGAKAWAQAAISTDPTLRDGYCLMAHASWWGDQNADEALAWAQSSIGKEEAPLVTCRNPREYTLNLWDVLHRAHAAKGDYEKALKIAAQAHEVEPITSWEKFIRIYAEAVRAQKSVQSAVHLADHLTRRGDTLRARWLLEGYLPANIRHQPEVEKARAVAQAATQHAYVPELYKAFYDDSNDLHDVVGTDVETFRWQWVFDRLKKAGVKTVLDVGCANAAPALEMARRGHHVTGLDIHGRNVERANKIAKKEKLPAQFIHADFEDWYGANVAGHGDFEPFDAVVMAELIEHLPPHMVGHFLRRADRVGRRVLITTPYPLSGDWAGLGQTGPSTPTIDTPREHLLEFTFDEMQELILQEHRRPVELYAVTQPWEEAVDVRQRTWVMEYDHGDTNDQTVVFYLGPGPEMWTPHSVDEGGIGGSETATVRMAEEFARRGHRVSVYAEAEGVYNGVAYQHYRKFDPRLDCWLLVISRLPALLGVDFGAKHVWLMCHDIQYGPQEHLDKAERILVLSEWHKNAWQRAYKNGYQPTITANGIVPPTEDIGVPQPHRFIWASSPDRGLDVLLEWWPEIRAMWGDAELHIFYGLNTLNSMAALRPHLVQFKQKLDGLLRQPGIQWHGRVGQKRLHEEFAKSQFWLYPSIQPDGSDWYETYCITALEAQANGCIPITRPVGALPERILLPDLCLVDSRDSKDVLKALRRWERMSRSQRENLRKRMADYARGHTWGKVCDQWLTLLRESPLHAPSAT